MVLTRELIKDLMVTIQRHGKYPSRGKVHRVLVALYGHGVSTNTLIPLLQQLRLELGIPCRPNRQAALRSALDSTPPRTDEAAHPTALPAPDPTPDAARGHGEPTTPPSHPERWSHCGGSHWGRFGQAERYWPAFTSEWWECLGYHMVHPPPDACRRTTATRAAQPLRSLSRHLLLPDGRWTADVLWL
jgi:hypothetical protein